MSDRSSEKRSASNLEGMFYIVSIGAIVLGGVLWLTTIDNKATASVQGVFELQRKVDDDRKAFEEIRIRLTHIEDAVNAPEFRSAPKARKF